ncbi:ABC transporter ATP-binding protein [Bdellovibrio bacteriovorus]|uniref:ABC transporter, ATP-binding protein n=1 Tax=Bdellovibrio bacteriovorus (strain ATCC 15356 / DSM 50701 / NCIMB 9529 / HD100) TaxID=264462 RepID=Q6MGW2_BDEBA|nr:ABC transporter ATP-binding protein [Bdellovibrio bacteriovorus]AHZ85562.1 ABC transporter ATP-binding protein [Bdellovibrio bacteriovorus]BEV70108.1 putative ribonucleotide transport ATP-binding protein mkl [Bdellovibrio bacteriovorus]CAE81167.1 ABC transporter, ATP-binding protein [Bdellovibrio bacteriovorus HD100]
MSIISLKDVTVAFEDLVVLKSINLEIQAGESFVIVGPSGQGKTTLLKTMSGLVSPRNGKVFVEQKDWSTLSSKERLPLLKKVGILFQKNALFDSLTCVQNISFPLRETTALSDWEITKKAEYFLDAVGIPHARDLYPDEISGGMQKRLGIARALALDPEIIFYDDPTAGLDPITSRKIIDLIMTLKKEKGSTVVAITNDMNRAFQMADRIGMVVDQELLITGTPDETKNHTDPRVHQFIRGLLAGPLTTANV